LHPRRRAPGRRRRRPDVVYVEHLTNALYLDRRDDVEQYLHVTESVCVRGDAPEKTVGILHAMLREV
jgi:hypothetical protein